MERNAPSYCKGLTIQVHPFLMFGVPNSYSLMAFGVAKGLDFGITENFNTPYQFYKQAQEFELKSYLIGIVGKLNDRERFGLLYAPSLERAIKEAAAIALEDTPTGEPAIEQINACIASLNHAKEQLLDSFSVLVEARKQ